MPYARNADLPDSIRNALPAEAQSTFRTIVNNALKQYDGDESRAFATAWAALRRAGWNKGESGKWHKEEVDKMSEPEYKARDKVTPLVGHMPDQKGRTATIALVRNGPYYALDFGDGEPHKWYAEDELRASSDDVETESEEADDNAMDMAKRIQWKRDVEIRKTNDDQRLVFGWLSVAVDKAGKAIVDNQGDVIEPEDLEKAAYEFTLYARKAGEMHERTEGIGRLVESMVFTVEKQQALGIPEGTVPVGWWVGFKIDDDSTWSKVKSGEYRAFSIGGRGIREEVT